MKASAAVLAVLGIFLVSSCDKKDTAGTTKPADTKPADTTKPTDGKPADPGAAMPAFDKEGPVVKLIEAGAEPRKQLRFKMTKGDKQTVKMHMKMSMGIDMGQGEQN